MSLGWAWAHTIGSSTNRSNTNHIGFLRLAGWGWLAGWLAEAGWLAGWGSDAVWCVWMTGVWWQAGGRCWEEESGAGGGRQGHEKLLIFSISNCVKLGGTVHLLKKEQNCFIRYQINSFSAFSKCCHTNKSIFISRFFLFFLVHQYSSKNFFQSCFF